MGIQMIMALDFISIKALISEFVFEQMKDSLSMESYDYYSKDLYKLSLKEMFYDAIVELGSDQVSKENIIDKMKEAVTEGVILNLTNDKEYIESLKHFYKIASDDIVKDIIKTSLEGILHTLVSCDSTICNNINTSYCGLYRNISKHICVGDIIGVDRAFGFYYHYGIYIGDNRVIHYTSPRCGSAPTKIILETDFSIFLQGVPSISKVDFGNIRVGSFANYNNANKSILKQDQVKLYTSEETVLRAKSCLYENRYHTINNNCEHFVVWCKTGLCSSEAVEHILNTADKTYIDLLY